VTQCNQQRGTLRIDGQVDGEGRQTVLILVRLDQCNSAQQSAQVKDFNTAVASTNIGPDPQFPDFDLICEG
jgi:hypothetical protein